jgi:hypothetical protein
MQYAVQFEVSFPLQEIVNLGEPLVIMGLGVAADLDPMDAAGRAVLADERAATGPAGTGDTRERGKICHEKGGQGFGGWLF